MVSTARLIPQNRGRVFREQIATATNGSAPDAVQPIGHRDGGAHGICEAEWFEWFTDPTQRALVGQAVSPSFATFRRERPTGEGRNQGVSTSTARDAECVPDAFGVHRVTSFRQASRVAAHRAYGFSVFTRRAPGLARAVWPWLWRVQMMGAGRQGSGIIISEGASLSLTGEPAQRPVWSAFLVGLLAYTVEIGLIITPAGTRTSSSLRDGRWRSAGPCCWR